MSSPPGSLPPEGARCALHPESAAAHTCVRCGNYMCATCAGSLDAAAPGPRGGPLCPACAERLALDSPFPFSRERYTISGLLEYCLRRWKERWLLLAGCFGLALLVIFGGSEGGTLLYEAVADEPAATAGPRYTRPGYLALQAAQSVLQVVVFLALYGVCLDVLLGQAPSWRRSAERLRALPAALLQVFVTYLTLGVVAGLGYGIALAAGSTDTPWRALAALVLYALVITPALVWAALSISFCMLPLALDPSCSALEGFARSFRAVNHQRLSVCAASGLVCVIMLVGALCCVGLLASLPIGTLLYCSMYLALRDAPPSSPPVLWAGPERPSA